MNYKYSDQVELGSANRYYDCIEKYRPDFVCLWYDQESFTQWLEQYLLTRKLKIDIIRMSPLRPDKYKSSKIKKDLENSK